MGKAGLLRHYKEDWPFVEVKTGSELSTGRYNLAFLETPMLHWPDSMMTYLKEAQILFSSDAFGAHLASSEHFDDRLPAFPLPYARQLKKYYANILMPFGTLITQLFAKIGQLGLTFKIIAPDHGLIYRRNIDWVLAAYQKWAAAAVEPKALVIYDTMWHSTEHMTIPIMQGIQSAGVEVEVLKLRSTPMSQAIKRIWESRAMLIGTPTLNNIMFPTVAEFLTHLRGLRPKNRLAGAFGSFGWGGGAVKEAYELFKKMGLETVEPGVEVLYRPSAEDENKCFDFGRQFAEKTIEYHKKFDGTVTGECRS